MKIFRSTKKLIKGLGSIVNFNNAEFTNYTEAQAKQMLEEYSKNPNSSCYLAEDDKPLMRGGTGNIDLSIILPTYNDDKHIIMAVESVLQQVTSFQYELIIVNDGSTDSTHHLLTKYKKIENVKIIEQENRGFSGARNSGIDIACGNYLMFVDSDDRLASGAVERLMIIAIANNADVVAGSYITVDTNNKKSLGVQYKNEKVPPLGTYYGHPWGKVYKSGLFKHLRFPEGYWYEDSIFAQILWPQCKACYTVSDIVYEHTINPHGITQISKGQKKSVDSLYITEALLKDKKRFNLSLNNHDYDYFLRMAKLTYSRTLDLEGNIKRCIFIVQCALADRYFGEFKTENKSLFKVERALRTGNYILYTLSCCMS